MAQLTLIWHGNLKSHSKPLAIITPNISRRDNEKLDIKAVLRVISLLKYITSNTLEVM